MAALTILLHAPLNPEGGCHVITFVGSMRGASLPRRSWYGIAGAALLIAAGAIHLDLYLTGYNSIPTIGPLFLLQIISAFLLAVAIPLTGLRLAYLAGAGFGLATLGGYLLSLKVGLFGFTEVRTTAGIIAALKRQTIELAKALRVRGLMNVQYAIKDAEIYVIEVNPRASRTVPFVSKATGISWAKIAARLVWICTPPIAIAELRLRSFSTSSRNALVGKVFALSTKTRASPSTAIMNPRPA